MGRWPVAQIPTLIHVKLKQWIFGKPFVFYIISVFQAQGISNIPFGTLKKNRKQPSEMKFSQQRKKKMMELWEHFV